MRVIRFSQTAPLRYKISLEAVVEEGILPLFSQQKHNTFFKRLVMNAICQSAYLLVIFNLNNFNLLKSKTTTQRLHIAKIIKK